MNIGLLVLQRFCWGVRWLWTRQPLQRLLSLPFVLLHYNKDSSALSVAYPASSPPFIHRPLESKDHIRVLQLLPSEDPNAPIKCRLHHVQLTSPQYAYTAISYVWGNKDLPKLVVDCDDGRAEITPSLHSALSRLRSRDREQYLWADALCIDQRKNNKEKSSQVRMMDQIYANAHQVVIDLGPVEEDLSSVLPHLDRYHSISSARWASIMSSQNTTIALNLLYEEAVPGIDADFWVLFPRFMQRPWFTRVWIIQEYALAKTHKFMIGKEFRDGTFLQTAVVRASLHLNWLYKNSRYHFIQSECPSHISEGLYMISDTVNAIQRILELRSRMTTNRYTFCELISMSTVLFQATNIRDRAYALMGLASDSNLKRDLVVDYAEDSDKFMLRLSQYLCYAGHSIYPLYHCVGDRKGCNSWAMNLGDKIKDDLSLLVVASGKTNPPLFNACGALNQYSCTFSTIRPGGLIIRGCMHLDTIDQAMGSSLPPRMSLTVKSPASSYSYWLGDAFLWMCSMAQLLGLHDQDKEYFVKQCWRTLIADVIIDSDQEQQGLVRTRDCDKSERCLDTWTEYYGMVYAQQKGTAATLMEENRDKLIRLYGECMGFAFGRRLGMTRDKRLLCLIPAEAETGDCIVLIQGCQIPFVLRRKVDEKGTYFRIVGSVYVHGIMDGEIVQQGGWAAEDLEIW
jgi:hypothetical protein